MSNAVPVTGVCVVDAQQAIAQQAAELVTPCKQVATEETCVHGHKMMYTDYITALDFVREHTYFGGRSVGGNAGSSNLVCRSCHFRVPPQEKVFVCECCTSDSSKNPLIPSPSLTPTVYCETCVETNVYIKTRQEWSHELMECNKDCWDFAFCYPCATAGLQAFMCPREEGEKPGSCGLWFFLCTYQSALFFWDFMTGFSAGGISACFMYQQTAVLNGIPEPSCCDGFCTGYWCRCCAMGRARREWRVRRTEQLGEPTGCLWNCEAQPARRTQQSVAYSRLAPVPMQLMSAAVDAVTSHLPTMAPYPHTVAEE